MVGLLAGAVDMRLDGGVHVIQRLRVCLSIVGSPRNSMALMLSCYFGHSRPLAVSRACVRCAVPTRP